MSKLSNILMMLEYLTTGRKYSIKELSEKLEVSPRMIRFYKDEIEKSGIYIDTIKGPYGGYVLNQKIGITKKNQEINVLNQMILEKTQKAIQEKRKCIIEYQSKDAKEITIRTIHPYEIIKLNSEWGVAAFCELKQEIRHFYLNRIVKIDLLEKFDN